MYELKCTNCGRVEEFEDATYALVCGFGEGWTAFNEEVYCLQCGLEYERLHTCGRDRSAFNELLHTILVSVFNTHTNFMTYPIKQPKEKYGEMFSTLSARERLEIYCREITASPKRAR